MKRDEQDETLGDDAVCIGCLQREAWLDGFQFATGASDEEAEKAFADFLDEVGDDEEMQ